MLNLAIAEVNLSGIVGFSWIPIAVCLSAIVLWLLITVGVNVIHDVKDAHNMYKSTNII